MFTPYPKNPLRGKPGSTSSLSFNADPDILIANNEMYVFNREFWRGTDVPQYGERLEQYMYKAIFDGDTLIDFEPAVKLYEGYGGVYTETNIATYASTSFIHDGSKFIAIDVVSGSWNSSLDAQNCKRIRYNEALTLTENCFQTGWRDIAFMGYKIEPWHMQVFGYQGKYYAIVCSTIRGFNGLDSGRIYLGEFDSGFKNLFIHGRALTDFCAYRSSAYVDENGDFILYANAYNESFDGGTGYGGRELYVTIRDFNEVLQQVKS